MALTAEEFDRFLMGVRPGGYQCAYCGTKTFLRLIGDPGTGQAPATFFTVPRGFTFPHDFYAAACSNCGNVNMFHALVVEAWLRTHPAPAPTGFFGMMP